MFRWRRCSEGGLSDWQRAKKIIIQIPTGDTRMFRNCDIAGCEIQKGNMSTPPNRASQLGETFSGFKVLLQSNL